MELHSRFIRLRGSADVSIIDRTRLWITSLINHHQCGSLRSLAHIRLVYHKHTLMQAHTNARTLHINLSTHR